MYGHSINIAEEAYKVADAMLEARTLKPEWINTNYHQ
jgi:hypothetical protein